MFLQAKEYSESVKLAQKAIEIDPCNVKAMFRKAQALEKMAMLEQAASTVTQLLEIEPENGQATKFLVELREKMNPSSKSSKGASTESTSKSSSDLVVELKNATPKANSMSSNDMQTTVTVETDSPEIDVLQKTTEDYGFMNPNWSPPETTLQRSQVSAVLTSEVEGISTSANTAAAMVENEKLRLKNEVFTSALKDKMSAEQSRLTMTPNDPLHSVRKVDICVGDEVKSTLQELSLEEGNVVEQMKAKSKSFHKKDASSSKKKSSSSINSSTSGKGKSSLKSKDVISDTAKSEWEALMCEENDIKKKAAAKLATLK